MEVLPKTWVSPNNHLNLSDKKLNFSRLALKNKKSNHKTPEATNGDGLCNQEKMN